MTTDSHAETMPDDDAVADAADDRVRDDGAGDAVSGDDGVRRDAGDAGDAVPDKARRRWRKHPVVAGAVTVLAGLLVLFALVAPNTVSRLTPRAFLRIPVEVVLGIAVVVILPARARRVVAVIGGALLGLVTILKLFDMGFYQSLDRPFDPVLDMGLLGDAVEVVKRSIGTAGAVGGVVVAVLLMIGVLTLMALSALRLTRIVASHRRPAIGTAAVLGVAWFVCMALGVQIVPGVPVASRVAITDAYHRARQASADVRDRAAFAGEATVDAFRDTPGPQLLTGLRGKDVVISFVESYGRVAVEDPEFAPQVGALLEAGNTRLHAAGFAARSAFLTSPTAGGGSWLAHSTLLSGLWIDNQQRYRTLLASDRLTLNRAFHRASWRTVDVEPGVSRAWPEGAFYGSDRLYTAQNLSYRGPLFNFASIPDQYTMAAFQRAERATPGHQPVMAEIVLLSSHTPWAPLPRMVDWDELGDGTVFAGQHDTAESETTVWRDRTRIRTAYRQSIEYSLDALISYVTKYGDDNLVLVFLGDHQPAPFIAGEGASRDVPITVVARDRAVLDRISGWGWQDGLKPGPQAPVWRMNAFRDRFLTAFGPQGGPGASPSPSPR